MLARMVARVRERVATRLWSRLARMLDDDRRRRLDALLEVPDGARVSHLEQLRRPPTALTARALAAAVERIKELRALDVGGLDLSGLPPARVAALARHAATARAGDLAQLAPERRAATLVAFAQVGETRAVDDALDMFYELLRGLTARVQRRGQAERLGTLSSLDAAASALCDAVAVLLDPAVPDDQVRASVFRRVEREALAAAFADCDRLVRPLTTTSRPSSSPAMPWCASLCRRCWPRSTSRPAPLASPRSGRSAPCKRSRGARRSASTRCRPRSSLRRGGGWPGSRAGRSTVGRTPSPCSNSYGARCAP